MPQQVYAEAAQFLNQPDAPRSRIDIVHPPQPPACNQAH